jgi:hypothetical protein
MSGNNCTPTGWASSVLPLIRRYMADGVAAAIARIGAIITPGVPPAAWVGVACNGGVNSNTTGWVTGSDAERSAAAVAGHTPLIPSKAWSTGDDSWSNRGFHELGIFGEEGGDARGPAPAPGSRWAQDAVSVPVVAALGHAATVVPGGWRAIPDQTAVGLAGLARHGREVRSQLPAELRWQVNTDGTPLRWTQWVFVCSVMGWSAGSTGAARHLGRWPELGSVDEDRRWGAWLTRLVDEVRPGTPRSHGNPYYSGVRTAQKMEAGRLAGPLLGDAAAAAWLDPGLGADTARVYDLLTAGGYGIASSHGAPGSGGGGSSSGSGAVKALGFVALLALGALLASIDNAREVLR